MVLKALHMPRHRPKGSLERTALNDLWKHTLSQIPTQFGRLVYLSSLRDPHTGLYRHHGLGSAFGREESGRVLRESHEAVFTGWMCLPMADKWADLHEYLSELDEPRKTVLDHWSTSYLALHIPDSARDVERELFAEELRALLAVLRNAPAGDDGYQPQDSSQSR
jgi:hypothetical protein